MRGSCCQPAMNHGLEAVKVANDILVWARNATGDPLLAMGLVHGFAKGYGFANTREYPAYTPNWVQEPSTACVVQALSDFFDTSLPPSACGQWKYPKIRESITFRESMHLTLCQHRVRQAFLAQTSNSQMHPMCCFSLQVPCPQNAQPNSKHYTSLQLSSLFRT